MLLDKRDVLQLRAALQESVVKCSERCLYQAAKWAAELLNAMPEESYEEDEKMMGAHNTYISPALSPNHDPHEAELEARELSRYLLAKSFFDCREYDRCAAVFLPDSVISGVISPREEISSGTPKGKGKTKASAAADSSSMPNLSQKSLFLALYAKFLSGEKQKDEDTEMVIGPQDLGTVVNKQLLAVGRFLETWFNHRTPNPPSQGRDSPDLIFAEGSQGWLEYLYGMVLAREKNEGKAMQYFLRSVHMCPMNWGCWLEIASLISRVEELARIAPQLPQNIVSFMFHIYASLELYQHQQGIGRSLYDLLEIFPTSSFLLTCHALLAYHSKDLVTAEQRFSRLLSLHPHRLDSLDHYSNILYVLTLRPKLAFLAHLCSSVDRFRPESCVVVGNYYSLLSQHEKAVQYFRRALTLDRSCLSAWTLMGHEYVELKNTHAAVESYRRAVDVNRRDYRAWYGLGQTYEMLEMHTYALWYYKRAAGLRPWDGKMWMAVGSCLQKMERDRDAVKALKRALVADSYYDAGESFVSSQGALGGGGLSSFPKGALGGGGGVVGGGPGAAGANMLRHMDPEILLQIATLYDGMEEPEQARAYMEMCVAQEYDGAGGGGGGGLDDEGGAALGESVTIHNDTSDAGGGGEEDGSGAGDAPRAGGTGYEGTGMTPTTSKARMWLARYAMQTADYAAALRLGTELCQDGVEVEEAGALVREAKARIAFLEARGQQ